LVEYVVGTVVFLLKLAITVFIPLTDTIQVVPEILVHPDQLVKVDPEEGMAFNVTEVVFEYASEQSDPQFIFPSVLFTVPLPVPALETLIDFTVIGPGAGAGVVLVGSFITICKSELLVIFPLLAVNLI
jgi:hypothetical protein